MVTRPGRHAPTPGRFRGRVVMPEAAVDPAAQTMQQRVVNGDHDRRVRVAQAPGDDYREAQPELIDRPARIAQEAVRPGVMPHAREPGTDEHPVTVENPVCEIWPTTSALNVCNPGCVKHPASRDNNPSSEARRCRGIGGASSWEPRPGCYPTRHQGMDAHDFEATVGAPPAQSPAQALKAQRRARPQPRLNRPAPTSPHGHFNASRVRNPRFFVFWRTCGALPSLSTSGETLTAVGSQRPVAAGHLPYRKRRSDRSQ